MKGLTCVSRGVLGWAAALAICAASIAPAHAQESSTDLPEVIVDAQSASSAPATAAPAATAQSSPSSAFEPSEAKPTEKATGPVDGIVATRSATGTKTDTPILEIPQTVNVVTKDEIELRGAQNVSEALRYTPGIRVEEEGASETRRDNIISRGFLAPQFLDGLPVVGTPFELGVGQIESYGLERIEVLKGPASSLFGRSAPGGLVNMVSKRPTDEAIREMSFQAGSFERVQGAFDFSGRSNDDGTVLFRLTGLAQDSGTQVDFQSDDRLYIAPSLTFRPSSDTTLTVLAMYQWDDVSPFVQAPLYGSYFRHASGRTVPLSRNYGEPGYEGYEREHYSAGYILDHRFSEAVSFHQALRYARVDEDARLVGSLGMLDENATELDRFASVYAATTEGLSIDNSLEFKFATGLVDHKLITGFDYSWSSLVDRSGVNYSVAWGGDVPSIDIFNPIYGAAFTRPALGPASHNVQEQYGLYAQDQIAIDNWILTLGGRYDWAPSRSDYEGTFPEKNDDEAFTGRAGLTYLFANGFAPYVSYSESFQPLAGRDANGSAFKPTTGTQYEAGVKYEPRGFPGLITASVFDITQQNVLTPDPNDPLGWDYVQAGEVTVRGFELEGKAEVARGLDVFGGYAYLDAEITKSTTAGEIGNRFAKVPRHQASFGFFYKMPGHSFAPGLGFGGGVRHIGNSFSDNANIYAIDNVTLFDASLSYDFGAVVPDMEGVTLHINATNLFDEEYFAQAGDYGAIFGNRRTVHAKMKYAW